MATTPIWKDIISYDAQHSGVLDAQVRIRLVSGSGETIHNGRIIAAPDASRAQIRINDIVRPYLFQKWPSALNSGFIEQDGTTDDGAILRAFYVEFKHGNYGWHEVAQPNVLFDWSYDNQFTPSYRMSFPIDGVLDSRQVLLWTTLLESNFMFRIWTGSTSIDFGFTGDIGPGTAKLQLGDYNGITKVQVLGAHTSYEFQVDNSGCNRFVLYYVNAYGGWDSLLLTGKSVKTDAYNRSLQGQVYDNRTQFTAGTKVYKNEVTRKWQLHTGWLSDEAASRMHHLLGTTLAMLRDFEENSYTPVIITNSDCVYKRFDTNGHRMASYTIEAEIARDLTRR